MRVAAVCVNSLPAESCALNSDVLWVNVTATPFSLLCPPRREREREGGGVKLEVAILGSPSLIVLMISVDVKQHFKNLGGGGGGAGGGEEEEEEEGQREREINVKTQND